MVIYKGIQICLRTLYNSKYENSNLVLFAELDVQQRSCMDLSVQLVLVRQDMEQNLIAEHSSHVQVTQTTIQDLVDVPKVRCIMILSSNVTDQKMWRDVKIIMRQRLEIFSNT